MMTAEEAKRIREKNPIEAEINWDELQAVIDDALDKQIAVAPTNVRFSGDKLLNNYYGNCGACRAFISTGIGGNRYCGYCGTKVDWGDLWDTTDNKGDSSKQDEHN